MSVHKLPSRVCPGCVATVRARPLVEQTISGAALRAHQRIASKRQHVGRLRGGHHSCTAFAGAQGRSWPVPQIPLTRTQAGFYEFLMRGAGSCCRPLATSSGRPRIRQRLGFTPGPDRARPSPLTNRLSKRGSSRSWLLWLGPVRHSRRWRRAGNAGSRRAGAGHAGPVIARWLSPCRRACSRAQPSTNRARHRRGLRRPTAWDP